MSEKACEELVADFDPFTGDAVRPGLYNAFEACMEGNLTIISRADTTEY